MTNNYSIHIKKAHTFSLCDIKVNVWSILLFVFLAFSLDFFYLFDRTSVNLFGLSLNDIFLIFSLVLFMFVFVTKRRFQRYHFEKFSIIFFLVVLAIVFTSSIGAYLSWNQPILYGLRAQRMFLFSFFIFASYLILYKEGFISKESILRVVYFVAIIELALVYIQWILGEKYIFLKIIDTIEIRYGTLRIRANPDLICLCTFISWSAVLNKKNVFRNLLFVLLSVGFVALISKSRMRTLCLLFSLVFSTIFIAKMSVLKKTIISVIVIALLISFFFTSIGQDILLTIQTGENDTSLIRDDGRSFYLRIFNNNPWFAGGYVNLEWQPSVVGSRFDQEIYVNDNGIFGFIFTYGIFGIIYIFVLYLDILISSIKYFKRTNQFSLISFSIFNLTGLYTLFAIGMTPTISLSVLLIIHCIQKQELKEKFC